MALPQDLAIAIRAAEEALSINRAGDLPLGFRQWIWKSIGPKCANRNDENGRFRQTRARIAISSVQKVLHHWAAVLPDDREPESMLLAAEIVLAGGADAEQSLWQRWGRLWTHCDNIANESDALQVVAGVGYGAAQALAAALRDEGFDEDPIDPTLEDRDVDAEEKDAGFFAAAVYARGPVWDEESSEKLRREFWSWWLNDAVRLAWEEFN